MPKNDKQLSEAGFTQIFIWCYACVHMFVNILDV